MLNIFSRIKLIVILVFCCSLWQSCNIINPKEQVPTYIHIDSFKFNSYLPGVTATHQITCISVYYNNSTIGFFDLPATIPILATGKGRLEISPGIAIDGLNNLSSVYPFYRIDTSSFTAQPGKIIYYTPQTGFYTDAKIHLISDFTGATGFVRESGTRDILTVKEDSLVFGTGGTGSVQLIAPGDSSIDYAIQTFAIPSGNSSYIEFDYNSSVPLYVGLQANLGSVVSSTPFFLAGINPSLGKWKKFYLSVADFNGQYQGTSYTFYIKTVLPDGQPYGRLLIDNIQLVTF